MNETLVPIFPVLILVCDPLRVIADVPIELDVFQENGMVQVLLPDEIVQEVVDEVRVPDGAGATVMFTLSVLVPPGPVHETVYVLLEVNAPVENDPVVLVPVLLVDEHEVALVEVQDIVVLAP